MDGAIMPDQKAAPKVDPWADDPSMAGQTNAPAANDDDWKVWQAQDTNQQPSTGFFGKLQKAVDLAASPEPLEPGQPAWPQRIASGMVRDVLQPLVHPFETAKNIGKTALNQVFDPAANIDSNPLVSTYKEGKQIGFGPAIERTIGGLGAGVGVSGAIEPAMAGVRNVRAAAAGSPDAAALRGLRVPSGSPKLQKALSSVQTSRPYLQGAKDLADLQTKIPGAKDEIWAPYQDAIKAIGDRKVSGPDGPTTVRELEQERQQLSALNRGLRQQNPEALQLAQQKGMTQAQLIERENAVKAALDPHLASTGIDPLAIRKNFGAVSQVGGSVSGRGTMLEPDTPFGISKIAKVDIAKPLTWPSTVLSGLKDIVAGRPLFGGNATDIGIREGFRPSVPKPNLGRVTTTGNAPPARVYVTPEPAMQGRGLSLGDGAPLVKRPQLPASTGASSPEPMIGIRNDYPSLEKAFAKERVPPTVFDRPAQTENPLFHAGENGEVIPARRQLPAPAKPKRASR